MLDQLTKTFHLWSKFESIWIKNSRIREIASSNLQEGELRGTKLLEHEGTGSETIKSLPVTAGEEKELLSRRFETK